MFFAIGWRALAALACRCEGRLGVGSAAFRGAQVSAGRVSARRADVVSRACLCIKMRFSGVDGPMAVWWGGDGDRIKAANDSHRGAALNYITLKSISFLMVAQAFCSLPPHTCCSFRCKQDLTSA